jgi:hypothetical protein
MGRKREQPVRCYLVSKKRFLLMDTLGFLLKAKIVPGNWSEKDAAMVGLEGLEVVFPRMELLWMELLWADQGFKGWEFTAWLKGTVRWTLELTSGISKPIQEDFKIAPRRWVVEAIPPVRCVLGSRTDDCVAVEQSSVGSEF